MVRFAFAAVAATVAVLVLAIAGFELFASAGVDTQATIVTGLRALYVVAMLGLAWTSWRRAASVRA